MGKKYAVSAYIDKMATVLYGCPPSEGRREFETQIVNQTQRFWNELDKEHKSGAVTEEQVQEKLKNLDLWLKGKLSGENYLSLLRAAEAFHPSFIQFMPETILSRYEEIRVARIWSALFEPESLVRLRSAVETEKALLEGADSGEFI